MKSLHLTLLVFCQLLLASFILYARLASALPVVEEAAPLVAAAPKQQAVAGETISKLDAPVSVQKEAVKVVAEAPLVSKSDKPSKDETLASKSASAEKPASAASLIAPGCLDCIKPFEGQVSFYHMDPAAAPDSSSPAAAAASKKPAEPMEARTAVKVVSPDPKVLMVARVDAPAPAPASVVPASVAPASAAPAPVVNGGLGPLHLLATTLCSYQPERLVADEGLNQLYTQRAALRKSLFEFMSLKFTNVERFSSRLHPQGALEIMPPQKSAREAGKRSSHIPSHGWPVVGKCTAHDLKLMAEAAYCEAPAAAASGRQNGARALEEDESSSAAVISKILHVSDPREAPAVERSIEKLNLTQQQLSEIQAQATSTRLCRKRALHLTKALFNHLAEDQAVQSDSWPQLYAQLSEDDCARRRMIDVVQALSSYRSDSTHIRRDNVEFAFAMDDLRAKVLEHEVNVPLTFDKQFIEVEQFLQQSVKLMLSNIDPEKARLTSIRYRSLIPSVAAGSSNSAHSPDEQCLELPQRLLAKNYPTDCNPTQFGQLPDVLRMTATSLELWSIEKELAKRAPAAADTHLQSPVAPLPGATSGRRPDVNECIGGLVSS